MGRKIEGLYQGSAKNASSREIAKAFHLRIEKEIRREKKQADKIRRLAAALAAAMTATSCTSFGASQMFSDREAGFVMLAGDAEGIKAYNDGIVGIITDTKATPDVKSSYWQNREGETSVRMMRTQTHLKSYSARKEGGR